MRKTGNKSPYIIAYGPTKDKIESFYIDVEQHKIQVRGVKIPTFLWKEIIYICFQMPVGYEIIRTFDCLFKIHKVFNMDFDKNIINAMNFVQNYVYKIKDRTVKISPRMEDIYNRVIRHIPSAPDNDSAAISHTP